MYCIKCGAQNDDDSKFCTKCGTELLQSDIVPIREDKETPWVNKRKAVIFIIGLMIVIGAMAFLFSKLNTQVDNGQVSDGIKVSILSFPPGANIYINSTFKGNTPTNISLPEGTYHLKMNLTGYKGISTNFNITSDTEGQEINVTLEPIDINVTLEPIDINVTLEPIDINVDDKIHQYNDKTNDKIHQYNDKTNDKIHQYNDKTNDKIHQYNNILFFPKVRWKPP